MSSAIGRQKVAPSLDSKKTAYFEMSTGDGFRFFAKYYKANKTDDDNDDATVEHLARREKKKYLYIQSCVA